MSSALARECEYCGSKNVAAEGDCKDCGNANRKPVVAEGKRHNSWYQLEAQVEAEEARPHPQSAEVPENLKVAQHQDWYQAAGIDPNVHAPVKAEPENAQVKSAVRYVLGALIVALLGAAGYLVYAMQQPVAVGLGAGQ